MLNVLRPSTPYERYMAAILAEDRKAREQAELLALSRQARAHVKRAPTFDVAGRYCAAVSQISEGS